MTYSLAMGANGAECGGTLEAPPLYQAVSLEEPQQQLGPDVRRRHRAQLLGALAAGLMAAALVCAAVDGGDSGMVHGEAVRGAKVTSLWRASNQFKMIPAGEYCKESIVTTETCEAAARELGLVIEKADVTSESTQPSGCFYFPSSKDGVDKLLLNMNPLGSGPGVNAIGLGFKGRALCEERETSCEFLAGTLGKNECPGGSSLLSRHECESMPYHFGGALSTPLDETEPADPKGCFFFNGHYYFNTDAWGSDRGGRQVYCKQCKTGQDSTAGMISSSPLSTLDWTDWGSGGSTKAPLSHARSSRWRDSVSSKYRKITVGTCTDIGWWPIPDQGTCEAAAEDLLLPDIGASGTTFAERPEGCYWFKNNRDQTETLWLNVNPYSAGNGAETSDLVGGGLRQPICQRTKTVVKVTEKPSTTASSSSEVWYRKIPTGTCSDVAMHTIRSVRECDRAAVDLGLVDTTADILALEVDRPEGCYYFQNSRDLTATLWMNTNPGSVGKGAEASDPDEGAFRFPVCASRITDDDPTTAAPPSTAAPPPPPALTIPSAPPPVMPPGLPPALPAAAPPLALPTLPPAPQPAKPLLYG